MSGVEEVPNNFQTTSNVGEQDERNESARTSQHGDASVVSHNTSQRGNPSSGSQKSSSHSDAVPLEPASDHSVCESGQQQHIGGGGDTDGGSGDTREDKVNASNAVQSAASLTVDHVKSPLTGSGSVSKTSESKKSFANSSRGGEESEVIITGDKNYHFNESLESCSTGHQIVSQILDEIIDTVIKTDENFYETSFEVEKKGQHGVMQQSSITTIKSEDDKGSVHMDPELQAQLTLEQETAALERQKIHQDNIALYHTLVATRANLKRGNTFLLKQMYEHYKRKKIEHLFKEMPIANVDMEGKYIRALLVYEDTQNAAVEEDVRLRKLVSSLENKMEAVETDLNQEWNNLIMREREIAKGLLSAQATQPVPEKQNVESMIQRQIVKAKELTKERLIYFKLRDIAAADECHLKSLENLGDNLTLMEYEQLKMQSQSCVEQLEERDADLHRYRCKATSAIQILAEIREKTHTLLENIEANKVILHDVNQQLIQTRERVGCEKKRRDMSRSDTVRLRQEAGLLSEPKLLQDYKESLSHKEILQGQMQELRGRFESQKHGILSLRKELAGLQQKGDRAVWTNKGSSLKSVQKNVLV